MGAAKLALEVDKVDVRRAPPRQKGAGELGLMAALEASDGDDVPAAQIAKPNGVFRAKDVPRMFHPGWLAACGRAHQAGQ